LLCTHEKDPSGGRIASQPSARSCTTVIVSPAFRLLVPYSFESLPGPDRTSALGRMIRAVKGTAGLPTPAAGLAWFEIKSRKAKNPYMFFSGLKLKTITSLYRPLACLFCN